MLQCLCHVWRRCNECVWNKPPDKRNRQDLRLHYQQKMSGTSFQINRTDKRNMRRTLLLIAVIVIVGALPVFWQYGTFMICTDYMRQQIPFIMETKRMLESGTPFWSWNTYVGDNFLAGYAFYSLTSPFVWLVALLPYRCIVHGLFLTLVLKYMCAFATSYAYIRKM